MEKITMLGTGHGFTFDLFNTCFLLENDKQNFLVDTDGGVEIVKNLNTKGFKLTNIHDIFISHCHTDHILGLAWILKKVSGYYIQGYEGKLNIYGNEEVTKAVKNIYYSVLPKKKIQIINEKLNFHTLKDNETLEIAGEKITFFDAHASKNLLYGFETILHNGKKLIFLGDETCNPDIYNRLIGADYVMHEAFCLDAEEEKFKPFEKHHSTVKSVCVEMNKLNIKNLILYHTEESHKDKKELYTKEAKQYFDGNVIVPNDLDEIVL